MGLVTYWTDKYELEQRIANIFRGYPTDSGWIRMTGKREKDVLYRAEISAEISEPKLVGELIFPLLSNRMVDTCAEFIKLVKDRNFYLLEGGMFC